MIIKKRSISDEVPSLLGPENKKVTNGDFIDTALTGDEDQCKESCLDNNLCKYILYIPGNPGFDCVTYPDGELEAADSTDPAESTYKLYERMVDLIPGKY